MTTHTAAMEEVGIGADAADDLRVTPLELFSDLVFAFALTQLTTVLVNDGTWTGIGRVLLIFGMIWWIYGGYIWLTNAVRPDRPVRKMLLLGSMVGFLMMGLAIPRAFQGDGVVFGLGYLLVVLIHAGLFTQASSASTFGRIVRVAPFNITSAILLIIAGALPGSVETLLWALALSIQILSPFVTRNSGFHIEPGHFVERYGLLVLIVLGESIVATGAGGRGLALTAAMVLTSALGLALTAALWWIYFASDEPEAEAALRATPEDRRPVRALASYFYAQIPMLLGVVAIAAAIRTALPHPTMAATESEAFLLAGGAAAFLAGEQAFRYALDLSRATWRLPALPFVLMTVIAGLLAPFVVQVGVLTLVLIAALGLERLESHTLVGPRATTSAG